MGRARGGRRGGISRTCHGSAALTPRHPNPLLSRPSLQVQKLTKGEMLMVNIGSTSTGGRVVAVAGDAVAKFSLTAPVCTQEDEKIALSRRVEGNWR